VLVPTLIAYCSSTPATHDALPDKVPGAESAESAAIVPLPSSNCHQCASVGVGAGVGVAVELGVGVDVGLDVGLDEGVALGVGVAPGGVGVGVEVGTIAVVLASVEFALFPLPSVPPV
jgi:hypothetical protein